MTHYKKYENNLLSLPVWERESGRLTYRQRHTVRLTLSDSRNSQLRSNMDGNMDQAERDRKDRKEREERERRVREKEEERKEREAERERREKEKEEREKEKEQRAKRAEELLMQEDSSSQSLLYLGREAIPKKIISLEQHTNLYCSKLGINFL